MTANPYHETVEALSEKELRALDTYFTHIDYALTGLYEADDTTNNWVSSEDVREYLSDHDMAVNREKMGVALSALAEIDAISRHRRSYCSWRYCKETDAAAVRKAIRYRVREQDGRTDDLPEGDFLDAAEELRMMDDELLGE